MSDEGQPGLLLVTPSLEQKDSGQVRCSYQGEMKCVKTFFVNKFVRLANKFTGHFQ